MFDILSVKFKVNILSRLVSNVIPNSLNWSPPQFSFHLVFIESVLYSFETIHTICVFEKFTLRLKILHNFLARLMFNLEILLISPV